MHSALLVFRLENTAALKQAPFFECPLKGTVEVTVETALSLQESTSGHASKRYIRRGNDLVEHRILHSEPYECSNTP
jgi:hypothetical protein